MNTSFLSQGKLRFLLSFFLAFCSVSIVFALFAQTGYAHSYNENRNYYCSGSNQKWEIWYCYDKQYWWGWGHECYKTSSTGSYACTNKNWKETAVQTQCSGDYVQAKDKNHYFGCSSGSCTETSSSLSSWYNYQTCSDWTEYNTGTQCSSSNVYNTNTFHDISCTVPWLGSPSCNQVSSSTVLGSKKETCSDKNWKETAAALQCSGDYVQAQDKNHNFGCTTPWGTPTCTETSTSMSSWYNYQTCNNNDYWERNVDKGCYSSDVYNIDKLHDYSCTVPWLQAPGCREISANTYWGSRNTECGDTSSSTSYLCSGDNILQRTTTTSRGCTDLLVIDPYCYADVANSDSNYKSCADSPGGWSNACYDSDVYQTRTNHGYTCINGQSSCRDDGTSTEIGSKVTECNGQSGYVADSWQYYCGSDGNQRKKQEYRAWTCSNAGCTYSTSWGNDQVAEYCGTAGCNTGNNQCYAYKDFNVQFTPSATVTAGDSLSVKVSSVPAGTTEVWFDWCGDGTWDSKFYGGFTDWRTIDTKTAGGSYSCTVKAAIWYNNKWSETKFSTYTVNRYDFHYVGLNPASGNVNVGQSLQAKIDGLPSFAEKVRFDWTNNGVWDREFDKGWLGIDALNNWRDMDTSVPYTGYVAAQYYYAGVWSSTKTGHYSIGCAEDGVHPTTSGWVNSIASSYTPGQEDYIDIHTDSSNGDYGVGGLHVELENAEFIELNNGDFDNGCIKYDATTVECYASSSKESNDNDIATSLKIRVTGAIGSQVKVKYRSWIADSDSDILVGNICKDYIMRDPGGNYAPDPDYTNFKNYQMNTLSAPIACPDDGYYPTTSVSISNAATGGNLPASINLNEGLSVKAVVSLGGSSSERSSGGIHFRVTNADIIGWSRANDNSNPFGAGPDFDQDCLGWSIQGNDGNWYSLVECYFSAFESLFDTSEEVTFNVVPFATGTMKVEYRSWIDDPDSTINSGGSCKTYTARDPSDVNVKDAKDKMSYNVKSTSVQIVNPLQDPDISFSSVWKSDNIKDNEKATVKFDIKNLGDYSPSSNIYVTLKSMRYSSASFPTGFSASSTTSGSDDIVIISKSANWDKNAQYHFEVQGSPRITEGTTYFYVRAEMKDNNANAWIREYPPIDGMPGVSIVTDSFGYSATRYPVSVVHDCGTVPDGVSPACGCTLDSNCSAGRICDRNIGYGACVLGCRGVPDGSSTNPGCRCTADSDCSSYSKVCDQTLGYGACVLPAPTGVITTNKDSFEPGELMDVKLVLSSLTSPYKATAVVILQGIVGDIINSVNANTNTFQNSTYKIPDVNTGPYTIKADFTDNGKTGSKTTGSTTKTIQIYNYNPYVQKLKLCSTLPAFDGTCTEEAISTTLQTLYVYAQITGVNHANTVNAELKYNVNNVTQTTQTVTTTSETTDSKYLNGYLAVRKQVTLSVGTNYIQLNVNDKINSKQAKWDSSIEYIQLHPKPTFMLDLCADLLYCRRVTQPSMDWVTTSSNAKLALSNVDHNGVISAQVTYYLNSIKVAEKTVTSASDTQPLTFRTGLNTLQISVLDKLDNDLTSQAYTLNVTPGVWIMTSNPFNPETGTKAIIVNSSQLAVGSSWPSDSSGDNGGFGVAGVAGAAGAYYLLNSLGASGAVNGSAIENFFKKFIKSISPDLAKNSSFWSNTFTKLEGGKTVLTDAGNNLRRMLTSGASSVAGLFNKGLEGLGNVSLDVKKFMFKLFNGGEADAILVPETSKLELAGFSTTGLTAAEIARLEKLLDKYGTAYLHQLASHGTDALKRVAQFDSDNTELISMAASGDVGKAMLLGRYNDAALVDFLERNGYTSSATSLSYPELRNLKVTMDRVGEEELLALIRAKGINEIAQGNTIRTTPIVSIVHTASQTKRDYFDIPSPWGTIRGYNYTTKSINLETGKETVISSGNKIEKVIPKIPPRPPMPPPWLPGPGYPYLYPGPIRTLTRWNGTNSSGLAQSTPLYYNTSTGQPLYYNTSIGQYNSYNPWVSGVGTGVGYTASAHQLISTATYFNSLQYAGRSVPLGNGWSYIPGGQGGSVGLMYPQSNNWQFRFDTPDAAHNYAHLNTLPKGSADHFPTGTQYGNDNLAKVYTNSRELIDDYARQGITLSESEAQQIINAGRFSASSSALQSVESGGPWVIGTSALFRGYELYQGRDPVDTGIDFGEDVGSGYAGLYVGGAVFGACMASTLGFGSIGCGILGFLAGTGTSMGSRYAMDEVENAIRYPGQSSGYPSLYNTYCMMEDSRGGTATSYCHPEMYSTQIPAFYSPLSISSGSTQYLGNEGYLQSSYQSGLYPGSLMCQMRDLQSVTASAECHPEMYQSLIPGYGIRSSSVNDIQWTSNAAIYPANSSEIRKFSSRDTSSENLSPMSNSSPYNLYSNVSDPFATSLLYSSTNNYSSAYNNNRWSSNNIQNIVSSINQRQQAEPYTYVLGSSLPSQNFAVSQTASAADGVNMANQAAARGHEEWLRNNALQSSQTPFSNIARRQELYTLSGSTVSNIQPINFNIPTTSNTRTFSIVGSSYNNPFSVPQGTSTVPYYSPEVVNYMINSQGSGLDGCVLSDPETRYISGVPYQVPKLLCPYNGIDAQNLADKYRAGQITKQEFGSQLQLIIDRKEDYTPLMNHKYQEYVNGITSNTWLTSADHPMPPIKSYDEFARDHPFTGGSQKQIDYALAVYSGNAGNIWYHEQTLMGEPIKNFMYDYIKPIPLLGSMAYETNKNIVSFGRDPSWDNFVSAGTSTALAVATVYGGGALFGVKGAAGIMTAAIATDATIRVADIAVSEDRNQALNEHAIPLVIDSAILIPELVIASRESQVVREASTVSESSTVLVYDEATGVWVSREAQAIDGVRPLTTLTMTTAAEPEVIAMRQAIKTSVQDTLMDPGLVSQTGSHQLYTSSLLETRSAQIMKAGRSEAVQPTVTFARIEGANADAVTRFTSSGVTGEITSAEITIDTITNPLNRQFALELTTHESFELRLSEAANQAQLTGDMTAIKAMVRSPNDEIIDYFAQIDEASEWAGLERDAIVDSVLAKDSSRYREYLESFVHKEINKGLIVSDEATAAEAAFLKIEAQATRNEALIAETTPHFAPSNPNAEVLYNQYVRYFEDIVNRAV